MGQNFGALTALDATGKVVYLNLDADGNLLVSSEAGGATTDAAVSNAGNGSAIALLKGLQRPLNQTYETVAASQTKQVLGGTGAIGDTLDALLIVPATTSPGAVQIFDSAGGTGITVFTGGATSVADLKPFVVPINARSAAGAWCVTTGVNVSVIGVGNFTA